MLDLANNTAHAAHAWIRLSNHRAAAPACITEIEKPAQKTVLHRSQSAHARYTLFVVALREAGPPPDAFEMPGRLCIPPPSSP